MKCWISLLVVLVAAIIAAGCSDTQAADSQSQATGLLSPSTVTTVQHATTQVPTPISQASVSDNTVTIQDYSFIPDTITVETGQIVRWENRDPTPHRIVFTDANGRDTNTESGILAAAQSYSRKFTAAGTYPYYCKIHPEMKGTVIVE